ncbi:DUF805 domain-containing protein [Flavobacteriales bacterium]|jgi:uncharacterized membrane protein YhaH (DUF805 family)|nr:DUF805 domain-containing protein [Flavobacteriales bacterium]
MFKNLFSFKGRITRKEFFFSNLIFYFTWFIFSWKYFYFNIYLGIPLLWFLLAARVKRCHDRNGPVWLLFIPIIYPIYDLWLLFVKGDVGDNKYGENPNNVENIKLIDRYKNGNNFIRREIIAVAFYFTIVFLMLTQGIIGIVDSFTSESFYERYGAHSITYDYSRDGCKDTGYLEYKPEAKYSIPGACKTPRNIWIYLRDLSYIHLFSKIFLGYFIVIMAYKIFISQKQKKLG